MVEHEVECNDKCRKKYRLAIQSVFLARENILFLKEWVFYHIELGVEHFYLYDNTGSKGRNGSTREANRYGIPFADITARMSDEDVQDVMKEILEEIPERVTYVKWTPENAKGKIVYGWNDALSDYIKNYGNESEWTCFMDMDEFLFSVEGKNLKDIVEKYSEAGIGDIRLRQKKFEDRFYNLDKYVTKIDKCIEGLNTTGYGTKHIIQTDLVDIAPPSEKKKKWNMHTIPVKNGKGDWINMKELRFNHYNTNEKQFKFLKRLYRTSEDFFLNGKDDSMKRYWDIIESKCGNNRPIDILNRYPSSL